VTWIDVYRTAFGDLQLKKAEFDDLMLIEFNARIDGYERRKIERLRELRMIISSINGQDQRTIISLPGDYDHLPEPSQSNKYRLAKIWGVADKWNVKPE